MKKELIYFRNCDSANLNNISLSFFSGETTAFLGLSNSGKNDFINALCGKIPFNKTNIFINNKDIEPKSIKKDLHIMSEINYSISDWTVYEYVGLVNSKNFLNKNKLSKEIANIFKNIDICIDVNKTLNNLSELEKRLVDLAKAYINNQKILLIEDELSMLTTEDLNILKESLSKLIKDKNMTAIVNVNSYKVSSILADNYIIFKKNNIIKKCNASKIRNKAELEKILVDNNIEYFAQSQYSANKEKTNPIIYRLNNIKLNNDTYQNFHFEKSKVSSIISINKSDKEKIFGILSGRKIDQTVDLFLDEKLIYLSNIEEYIKNKIVSISNLTSSNEFIKDISIGENILLPSLSKLNSLEYIMNSKKITSILENQLLNNNDLYKDSLNDNKNFRENCIILERWYLFKPKVLIIYEPFNNCDVKGINLIKSYINKFKKNSTAIIIIISRKSDIYDISDFIYKI